MRKSRLIEHFVAGTTASLCCVNRKTAALYFHRLREIMAFDLEAESEAMFVSEIEVDESYFGGKAYTKIIPDASPATLMPIIERNRSR
jgi:transposase